MKLTDKQRDMLQRAAQHPLGLCPTTGTSNGLGSASRRRMMSRLTLNGLVRNYVHGGHEITEAGRAALGNHEQGATDNGA